MAEELAGGRYRGKMKKKIWLKTEEGERKKSL
jgi:hypothetical protein